MTKCNSFSRLTGLQWPFGKLQFWHLCKWKKTSKICRNPKKSRPIRPRHVFCCFFNTSMYLWNFSECEMGALQEIILTDLSGIFHLIHTVWSFPNPIFTAFLFFGMRYLQWHFHPPKYDVLLLTLHKLETDLPRYPWKVSKVVQEASLYSGGANRWKWGGERRTSLATGWAELCGRPDWETACRRTSCR